MRIGLVCPYSLTVPGGVQGQVLGLARELRRLGHEARVLGPCDGPPPESFVTPLGNSLPTAANGSVAPIAPDASAALRTIRALNDEAFDIVHVHEPLAPGPTMTSVLMHPAPMVGTFHAAGRSTSYRFASGPLRWAAGRIDRKVVVSKDAMELVQSHLGGEYDILFNGVEIHLIASTAPTPDGVPDDLLLWAPRGAQGPRRAARRRSASLPATYPPVDRRRRPRRPRLRAEYAEDKRIELARAHHRRREVRPPARRSGVLRTVVARRVVRRRARRGDGGRDARRGQRSRRLSQRRHRRRGRPPRGAGRRRRAGDGARAVLDDRLFDRLAARRRPPPGRGVLDDTLAAEYTRIYRELLDRCSPNAACRDGAAS